MTVDVFCKICYLRLLLYLTTTLLAGSLYDKRLPTLSLACMWRDKSGNSKIVFLSIVARREERDAAAA